MKKMHDAHHADFNKLQGARPAAYGKGGSDADALAKRRIIDNTAATMQRQLDDIRASLAKIEASDRQYRCIPPPMSTLQ